MRNAIVIPIRRGRPTCLQCGRRPAITRIGDEYRVAKFHDVCRQCWRSWMDSVRLRATRLGTQLRAQFVSVDGVCEGQAYCSRTLSDILFTDVTPLPGVPTTWMLAAPAGIVGTAQLSLYSQSP